MISVIVPVYNVAAWLPRCLDSLLGQTFGDFELLLVDDGSTDGSGAICDDYARRDARVRAFHKANGGLSDARNHGLERMRGETVAFVDSDDYVGPDCLRILQEMIDGGADVAVVGMAETDSPGADLVPSGDVRTALEDEALFREMLIGKAFGVSACGKLFRREAFAGARFPVGQAYEDCATIPQVISRCARGAFSRSKQYYYFQRPGSISHAVTPGQLTTWFDTMDGLMVFTERNHPALTAYARARVVKFTFSYILDRVIDTPGFAAAADRVRAAYGPLIARAWRLPELTFKERVKVAAFVIHPNLFRAVRGRMLRGRQRRAPRQEG